MIPSPSYAFKFEARDLDEMSIAGKQAWLINIANGNSNTQKKISSFKNPIFLGLLLIKP